MEKLLAAKGALTTVLPDNENDGGSSDGENQCEASWKGFAQYLTETARQSGKRLLGTVGVPVGEIYSSQARRNEYSRRWYQGTFRPPLNANPETGPGLSMWMVKDPTFQKATKRMCCTGATATNIISKTLFKVRLCFFVVVVVVVVVFFLFAWLKPNTSVCCTRSLFYTWHR
jgi:hypothetical protein